MSSSTSAPAGTSAVNTTGGGTYTVKSGDTLSAIAARHGITLANLKAWNGLSSNNIKVGQKLKVSDTSVTRNTSTPNNSDYTVYTVKSGDSFYSISKKYPGVSAENIMDFNGLTSSKLKPGMQIKIPKK